MTDKQTLWLIIGALAIGSFGLRFVFTGLVGDRAMPEWILRYLRYTGVAILPALVAPLVVWPSATGGDFDGPRVMAAVVTLLIGLTTKRIVLAILGGAITLYAGLYLFG